MYIYTYTYMIHKNQSVDLSVTALIFYVFHY